LTTRVILSRAQNDQNIIVEDKASSSSFRRNKRKKNEYQFDDPLAVAMTLYNELQELAKSRREIQDLYLDLAKQCENFAVELLKVNSLLFIFLIC